MFKLSRRQILKSAASAAAIGGYMSLRGISRALAKETISAIGWGGVIIKGLNAITPDAPVDVEWQTYSGATATFLTKLKASWPDTGLDLIQQWDPTFQTVAKEGWAEPVTVERVPNLANVSPKLFIKDPAGNVVNVPTNLSAFSWASRDDIAPFEITKLDDLLDKRLKGKVLVMPPTSGSNLGMLSMALYKGGDERNMEPGWDFMKRLASSGNIGRVALTDIDVTNSISSGETCVCFTPYANVNKLPSSMKIRFLVRSDRQSGFLTFFYSEGWSILKNGKTGPAFEFANYMLSPEQNTKYCEIISGIPANSKATPPEAVKLFTYSPDEMDKYGYVPDWAYLTDHTDAWAKRWETEIQPLL
ncbi:extracellular solute-binding protein (plasmid) [Mesorhizobium sp. AR07]|uniref:extracellular solute-binding protein n=1 Tax=Mesorhizobium sp. AR07 TaxID=2865838 RepID=UPI002160554F|nr:extracellular solute-binding protein [Mesorhizobium sp. AR07]UVK49013.1 extracellular solute-binding protein [Mesorhizobium sp. AR07]